MQKLNDLTGKRFTRLLVISRAPNGVQGTRWNVVCDCGVTKTVARHSLGSGTQSCGCKRQEQRHLLRRTHGGSNTQTYKIWLGMHARCYRQTSSSYSHYGACGIIICARWHSYALFLEDMGERPENFSIDRIDSSGNYEPANCRWASSITQNSNRRNNRFITVGDKTETVPEWSRKMQLPQSTILGRLNRGWSEERAVLTPRLK